MRRSAALILAVGLVASLAACAGGDAESVADGCTPAGGVSDGVSVTGAWGSKPEVTLNSPLTIEDTQRTVVSAGDGEVVEEGDTVNIEFVLYNGTTGDELPGTEYSGTPAPFAVDEAQILPGIVKTLRCSELGSRVVGVISASDSFGDQGAPQLGINPGDPIVFVVDLVSLADPPLARAEGEAQEPVVGMPVVELAADGAPTITIPEADPPQELQIAVLIKGDGQVVPEGANVVVHYMGINWNTDTVFDQSWSRGSPSTFNTRQVIAGFTAALEGQTVGSQVLVVIPSDQGYGSAGNPGAGIGGEDTLVFVVDILGVN